MRRFESSSLSDVNSRFGGTAAPPPAQLSRNPLADHDFDDRRLDFNPPTETPTSRPALTGPVTILFVCDTHGALSKLAASLAREIWADLDIKVSAAGVTPGVISPAFALLMTEAGLETVVGPPLALSDLEIGQFDAVIALGIAKRDVGTDQLSLAWQAPVFRQSFSGDVSATRFNQVLRVLKAYIQAFRVVHKASVRRDRLRAGGGSSLGDGAGSAEPPNGEDSH